MATAAFKSTTKRSSIGGADDTTCSSSGGLRRTRSVSHFSHHLPSELIDFESNTPLPSTRRKFVNTVRGSRFSEISLDDLAVQLFSSGERARSSEFYSSEKRRGRSVSRQTSSGKSVNFERSSGDGGLIGADRRRRSHSVVQFRASDLELNSPEKFTCTGNAKSSNIGSNQKATLDTHVSPNNNRGLWRCSSKTDSLKLHDSCSSQSYSSTLTDDEPCDACYGSDGNENSQSINASKKLDQLEVVQKKHRNASEEIKMGRKQQNQRNNHSQKVPRWLKEDADKIIEDFISSVEDNTDMSSFDGERSDTSSALGVSMRSKEILMNFGELKCYKTSPRAGSVPIEMDGVVLPWLLWETSNDDIPQFKYEQKMPSHSNTYLQDEGTKTQEEQNQSNSNGGNWCPALKETISTTDNSKETGEATSYAQIQKSQLLQNVPKRSRVVYVDDYLAQRNNEDCLLERWELRNMIKSGGILICESSNGPILL